MFSAEQPPLNKKEAQAAISDPAPLTYLRMKSIQADAGVSSSRVMPSRASVRRIARADQFLQRVRLLGLAAGQDKTGFDAAVVGAGEKSV
jgi:hypothetical protein